MTISMAVPVVALAFEGTSVSSGTFSPALRLITQISLAGTSVSNGTCVLTQSDVPGAFADFALVPYVPIYGDPAFSHVTSAVYRPGGTTDTVGQWKRLSLTMIAPNTDYAPGPLGRIYGVFDQARVGVQSANMAVGKPINWLTSSSRRLRPAWIPTPASSGPICSPWSRRVTRAACSTSPSAARARPAT